jgi:hypothetical protein
MERIGTSENVAIKSRKLYKRRATQISLLRNRKTTTRFKNGLAVDGCNPPVAKAPGFTALFGTTEVVP